MRRMIALGLALLAAACGGTTQEQAGGTGGGGSGGAGSTTTGSTSTTGTGASAPQGKLCDEVTVLGTSCMPQNYHDPLISYVRDSSIIFEGTVKALHQTTTGITLTDTSRTIVAHVDKTLFNGGMPNVTGMDVTVQMLAAPTMQVGYQGYFFTQVFEEGQTVGVNEIAHVDPGVYPTIESDVPGVEVLLADERLYARMQTAGSVVVGTVTAITPLMTGGGSEHDPLWAEATITADCALRGATPATTTAVFATSDDVAWFGSPKLTMGQQGVFLLQPVPSPPGGSEIPAGIPYMIVDPLDAHPLSDRPHLATLVLCPPSE